jgi:hypothetical protein
MKGIGNVRAKTIYELNAPSFYIRPSPDVESPLVRENWIRAKYVRKEFMKIDDDKEHNPTLFKMPERVKEGYLQKANEANKWQKRWFVLLGPILYYYEDSEHREPKGHLDMRQVTVRVPETTDSSHKFSFEIVMPKRVYPICADKEEEMFSWLHAIRRVAMFYGAKEGKSANSSKLVLSEGKSDEKDKKEDVQEPYGKIGKPVMEGLVSKLHGGLIAIVQKKWIFLSDSMIFVFTGGKGQKPPDNELPELAIPLDGSDISDFAEKTKKKNCFVIHKPNYQHYFYGSSSQEVQDWINAINGRIEALNSRISFSFAVLLSTTNEEKEN